VGVETDGFDARQRDHLIGRHLEDRAFPELQEVVEGGIVGLEPDLGGRG
jgi:hypothetical protein